MKDKFTEIIKNADGLSSRGENIILYPKEVENASTACESFTISVMTAFAEWKESEFWILSSNDLWYQKSDGNPDEGLTTRELITKFFESEEYKELLNNN